MTGKSTFTALAPVALALLAGAMLPFQAASNALVELIQDRLLMKR